MADTTLGADCALSKRDDETSQQFADRLLAAHRAAQAAPVGSRDGLDTLEAGNCQIEYVRGLTHAIMDIVENIHDLVHNGAHKNSNLSHFTSRAITLLCLQLEKGDEAASKIAAAVDAWPVASAQA